MSYSKYLMETPNFEGIPKLERLDLTGCTNLSQVHISIGLLTELTFLSMRNCSNLVTLNFGSESNLSSLQVLHLSGCTKLENTPDFIRLSNLEYLDLEHCTILSTVHKSIGALAKLRFLSLRNCTSLVSIPNSVNTMTSLKTLDLCGCLKLMNLPLGQRSELEEPSSLGIFRSHDTFMSSCLKSLIFLDVGFCKLREVPRAIEELRCLERLNLKGNDFVSIPSSISWLSSLAYLNLEHCHELKYFPELPTTNASSVGRYFEMVSGSRNHRSGLYVFDCPNLMMPWLDNSAMSWLIRLVQQPHHFRCGFDIIIPGPGNKILEWFNHQFMGDSKIRIKHSFVADNWIGFAFCVAFEVNYGKEISGSSHNSFPLPHPLYLSFESAYTEERFDMPLCLDLAKIDGSKHVWLIYISRPHCHFLKSGARIAFKACPDLEMRKWGLRTVFKQDIEAMKKYLNYVKEPQNKSLKTGEGNQVDRLPFDYVDESCSNSSGPKIQLPYNWLITEEEENENLKAKEKENNLSNIGL